MKIYYLYICLFASILCFFVILFNLSLFRLSKAQTFEEVQDCYAHFMLYYGHDVPAMKEALKAKIQKENKENELEDKEPDESTKIKHIPHKDTYHVCKDAGIGIKYSFFIIFTSCLYS